MASVLEKVINAGYPANQIVVLTAYLAQKQARSFHFRLIPQSNAQRTVAFD